jgi:DNA polymerase-3 subunit delta'
MKTPAREPDDTARRPIDAHALVGHADAETMLLNSYRSGRIPHAWLVGGPAGIGKATLAYRMARFVLAHPDPAAPVVAQATALDVDPDHPAARRLAAGTHGGLLVLERTLNDKGVLRMTISADEARETAAFFGATSAEGGWRVCIVDTVDDLNAQSANALLKVLEEPPARALFLLLSHAPGRVLPTIQSRCRRLRLTPLTEAQVIAAAVAATGLAPDDPTLSKAAHLSEGSVSQALMLMGGKSLGLHERTSAMLAALPRTDPLALHALGDQLAGTDRVELAVFRDAVEAWLARQLRAPSPNAALGRLARVSEVWEKVGRAVRDAEIYNLDRKPLVFSVFGLLAEVAP